MSPANGPPRFPRGEFVKHQVERVIKQVCAALFAPAKFLYGRRGCFIAADGQGRAIYSVIRVYAPRQMEKYAGNFISPAPAAARTMAALYFTFMEARARGLPNFCGFKEFGARATVFALVTDGTLGTACP